MPSAAPCGSLDAAPTNGFDSVSMNVSPLSSDRHHGRRRAEAGGDDVAAALAEEAVEHAVAAAQDRLVVQPVGRPDPRHHSCSAACGRAARLAVHAGERQAAADVELVERHAGRRRVERGARRRLERLAAASSNPRTLRLSASASGVSYS